MGSGKFIEIKLDTEAMRAFEKSVAEYPRIVAEELGKAVKELVLLIEATAKELCPVATGKLRASIHPVVVSWAEGFVATNTEYAADVEYGTEPHDIVPRTAKALAIPVVESVNVFSEKGRRLKTHDKHGNLRKEVTNMGTVLRKRAHHPGTQAQPFLEPAFLEGGKRAPRIFEKAIEQAMQRLERSLS